MREATAVVGASVDLASQFNGVPVRSETMRFKGYADAFQTDGKHGKIRLVSDEPTPTSKWGLFVFIQKGNNRFALQASDAIPWISPRLFRFRREEACATSVGQG